MDSKKKKKKHASRASSNPHLQHEQHEWWYVRIDNVTVGQLKRVTTQKGVRGEKWGERRATTSWPELITFLTV